MSNPDSARAGPDAERSDAVHALLDAAALGELATEALTMALLARCRGNSDATWQALALLDQYFRRGRIDAATFAAVKAQLQALIFPGAAPRSRAADAPATNAANRHGERTVSATATRRAENSTNSDAAVSMESTQTAALENARTSPTGQSKTEAAPSNTNKSSIAEYYAVADGTRTHSTARVGATIGAIAVIAGFLAWLQLNKHDSASTAPKQPTPLAAQETTSSGRAGEIPLSTAPLEPGAASPESHVAQSNRSTAAGDRANPTNTLPSSTGSVHLPAAAPTTPNKSNAPTVPTPTASNPESNAAVAVESESPTPSSAASSGVELSFVTDPVVVGEDDSSAQLNVRRSGSTRKALLVHWRTFAGSAKPNRDYVPVDDGELAFAPGARTADIVVAIAQRGDRPFSDWFEVEVNVPLAEIENDATSAAEPASVRATVVLPTTRPIPDDAGDAAPASTESR